MGVCCVLAGTKLFDGDIIVSVCVNDLYGWLGSEDM